MHNDLWIPGKLAESCTVPGDVRARHRR
jgi:hypothetical protein